MSIYSRFLTLVLISTYLTSYLSAAATGRRSLQQQKLPIYEAAVDDSLVHEEFAKRFNSKRRLSRAVDEMIAKLKQEEQECREQEQREEQCADDNGGQDGEAENIVAPPTDKPDESGDQQGQDNDQDQGQGQGQDEGGDQGHGQGDGQGNGQGQGQGGEGHGEHTNEEAKPGKKFYIESIYNGKVVEITPNVEPIEGAKVQMWDKRGSNDLHQLWVVGEDTYIRSALERGMEIADTSKENRLVDALRDVLNGRVPDQGSLREGFEREGDLTGLEMHAFTSHYSGGRWRWNGALITNEAGYALTIRDASKENGARLIQTGTYAEAHKEWKLKYVD